MTYRRCLYAAITASSTLALAACGGSSGSSSSASSSATTTAAVPPLSAAAATKLAAAINLTAADLPGYTSAPNPISASDKVSATQLAACAGEVAPATEIVDANSVQLSAGSGLTQTQASSNVTVLPTAAAVQQNLSALTSARGKACLIKYINAELAKSATSGVVFSSGRLTTIPVATAGTDGGFGARVTVNATASGLHIPFYLDVIGTAKGPVETELETLGIGKPFPAADETRLATLLSGRLTANAPTA
jgi:hypothetical protein